MSKTFVLFSIFYFLFSAVATAETARVYIHPSEGSLEPGQEFVVRVLVDAEQPLNAYSVTVDFDPAMLEFIATDTSKSIISIWQQLPVVTIHGSIKFNGASITPFAGTGGELFAVRFRVMENFSSTSITVPVAAVYLANGKGTKVLPVRVGADFERIVLDAEELVIPEPPPTEPDITPPAISFMEFAIDPVGERQKLAAFVVHDRESGVREVLIRSRSWFAWSAWQTARNPMPYGRGVWAVELRVSDHAGNETSRTLYDANALLVKVGALVVGLCLLVVGLYAYLRGRIGA